MNETEVLVKKQRELDLQTALMAELVAIKGNQFGKPVYSTVLPFKDLMKFLNVFPEVQRQLNSRKVTSIKTYTLSGMELMKKAKRAMRFFPGITCTARGDIYYNDSTQKVAINTKNSNLSVNDGQHRMFGIDAAIEQIKKDIDSVKKEERAEIRQALEMLENMTIPLTIFSELDEKEEKQLFYDTNNLASRPSRSATIRLSQTDITSKLAREVSETNRYFKHYGVEYDKMSIHKNNPNTILLTTIYNCIKEMFKVSHKRGNDITLETYDYYKKMTDETFSNIFMNLPPDINVKGKYLLEKTFALRGIARFINVCRLYPFISEKMMFNAIGKVKWEMDIDYWKQYNASLTKFGNFTFGSGETNSVVAIFDALVDNLPKDIKMRLEEERNKEKQPEKKKEEVADQAPDGQLSIEEIYQQEVSSSKK